MTEPFELTVSEAARQIQTGGLSPVELMRSLLARSRVLEYISGILPQLPVGVEPTLGPDATGVGWVFEYVLESDSLDLSIISADYLAQFDAVMFFTNGNLPFTDSQNRAIIDFVKSGKGFIGIHCASLTLYTFPEYGEMLGGYFEIESAAGQGSKIVFSVPAENAASFT